MSSTSLVLRRGEIELLLYNYAIVRHFTKGFITFFYIQNKDGGFLVRDSGKYTGKYTVSVFTKTLG